MFLPFAVALTADSISNFFKFLRHLRKHEVMRIIKTWTNAWATSSRFHEARVLPCLFGCPEGTDRLDHYVMCPNLYAIQITLSRSPVPDSPMKRLGLIHTNHYILLLVACTFAGYHAIRRSDFIASCDATPLDIEQQLHAANLFADAFRAEAAEIHFPFRAGSLERSQRDSNPFCIVRRAPA